MSWPRVAVIAILVAGGTVCGVAGSDVLGASLVSAAVALAIPTYRNGNGSGNGGSK